MCIWVRNLLKRDFKKYPYTLKEREKCAGWFETEKTLVKTNSLFRRYPPCGCQIWQPKISTHCRGDHVCAFKEVELGSPHWHEWKFTFWKLQIVPKNLKDESKVIILSAVFFQTFCLAFRVRGERDRFGSDLQVTR